MFSPLAPGGLQDLRLPHHGLPRFPGHPGLQELQHLQALHAHRTMPGWYGVILILMDQFWVSAFSGNGRADLMRNVPPNHYAKALIRFPNFFSFHFRIILDNFSTWKPSSTAAFLFFPSPFASSVYLLGDSLILVPMLS